MEKSQVVDNDSGDSKDSRVRTSWGMFLSRRGQTEIVARLEERIAAWTVGF
jgi:prolyl 4-hydroxylase